ncbi:Pentatricopeptide repeat-containing protein [Cynara cardunculus var. scolymus]|uniref:Pentatricopeptide repeat-containing protein n=1 Tax=Cynara cardunculus var. scolymus TaxID=59895 RepID=A0A103YDU7_CYNCS|nr:Pentatricopeptide repeat-containing protein [Cynara cardunculus var. scolymus]
MNALLLPPPLSTTNRFLRHRNRYQPLSQPLSSTAFYVNNSSLRLSSSSSLSEDDTITQADVVSLYPHRRYDFSPLLQFLSTYNSDSDSASSNSPASLDQAELRLAESYRVVPAPLWHALLKSLTSSPSSKSSFSIGYALVTWLQKHNLCFSYELLYSILIHALGRSEKLYEAFLLAQRQTLTPLTYNALIGACARNDELEKAINLMNRMRREGYQSDFVNYSLIIQSLVRSNKIDSGILEKLYDEMISDAIELDWQLLNDIVLGFAKSGDVDRAMYFLGVIQGKGMNPRTSTMVSLISELGNLGRAEEAEAVFEEIKEGELKPRTRAYNAVLKGYVKNGSLKDAEWIVSEMEKNGVLPDEHTYSLLIDAYGNAGRWESARIVLKEMESNDVKPNSFVFSRILASYRDRGEWQKSFKVLKEMQSCGVKPDRQFYNVMIDTFGKKNILDHVMATVERMKVEGIEPDTVTWNTLIDCHCKSGQHEKAEKLFDEMQQSGCLPCETTYNIMINLFGQQEKWEKVKSLLGKMQSDGLLPNIVTYTTLVDVYGKSGRYNDAIECLEVMKSAANTFKIMTGDGLKPSNLALNALINAFSEDKRDVEAFAVLQYMKENASVLQFSTSVSPLYHAVTNFSVILFRLQGLKADVVTYTTLMKALIRVEKFSEAFYKFKAFCTS